MKPIYLRLMDREERPQQNDQALAEVKQQVEAVVPIYWTQPLSLHPKGGYIVLGEIPDGTSLEKIITELHETGLIAVI